MPASIVAFLKTKSYLEVKYTQQALWEAFEADFGKYSTKTQHRYLKKLLEEAPRLLGNQVKYSKIDPELPNPSRDMKLAIELLRLAGLLHPITTTSAGGIPLLKGMKSSVFKLLFLDIGLIEQIMKVDPQDSGLLTGPLAEQFIGQEFLAYSDPQLEERLFYWTREKTGSSAEVDYLIAYRGSVFPLEVKAGKTGKLKSLLVFIEEKKAPFGIRVSSGPLEFDKGILSLPFYMFSQIHRLIDEALHARVSEK
jgi:predicted AAA+ superfamily ATPase